MTRTLNVKITLELLPISTQNTINKNTHHAALLKLIKTHMVKINPDAYLMLYGDTITPKYFASSLYFENVDFTKDKHVLSINDNAKLHYIWQSDNTELINAYLPTFLHMALNPEQPFTENYNVRVLQPKINTKNSTIQSNTIIVKTNSPIVVNHHKFNKNNYYDAQTSYQKFEEQLKYQLQTELTNQQKDPNIINDLSIIPVDIRKNVHNVYGELINMTTGTFVLSGPPELLTYIVNNGIGVKRGLGYGLVKQL